jgi:serine/threonine protein kinase
MHSKNIIPRDLKPENLLLKRKPRNAKDIEVKIIDFGLSKVMPPPLPDESALASTFLGTRGYLAPEMLQRRDYDKSIDTWALGIIVYVLLCGCLPFDDDSQPVATDDLVKARFVLRFPRWAKNLSESSKDLLNKLLDVNPETRYTAEQALRHPWVTGQAASKDNVLESPGRIRRSPAYKRAHATGAGSPHDYNSPSPTTGYSSDLLSASVKATLIPPRKQRQQLLRPTPKQSQQKSAAGGLQRQLVRKTSI